MAEQNKVGAFIALCRKEKQMTQKQLGEKLNVTDRAVSKWETGRSFPDVNLLEPLCRELDISVSELLAGKKFEAEKYQQETEKILKESVSAGQLMGLQAVLYILSLVIFLLIDFPFIVKRISGVPLLSYTSIFCWALALVLVFCIDYLDKKMPARKFRVSNIKLERQMGAVMFGGIIIGDFIAGDWLSALKASGLFEKIYTVVLFVAGFAICIGIRGIQAKTHKEEWEMEQEEKQTKQEK